MSPMARRLVCRLAGQARTAAPPLVVAAILLVTGALSLASAFGLTSAFGLPGPPPARADGDPASDALIGQSVFYPYTAPVAGSLQATLNAETGRLARAGLRLKVAIIGAPLDLGAIPELFGKPEAYARFLETEISFDGPQPLLTVMADGFGAAALAAPVRAAVAELPRPAGRSDDALARAAIVAVGRIAAADGHPLPAVTAGASATGPAASGSSPGLIIAAVAVLAAVAAGGILAIRRRRVRRARRARGVRTRPGRPRPSSRPPSRGTDR
jgi:hypothetical protein